MNPSPSDRAARGTRRRVRSGVGLLSAGLVSALTLAACSAEPADEDLLRLPGIRVAQAAEVVSTASALELDASRLTSAAYTVPGFDARIFLRDGQWEDAARQAVAQMSEGLHALGDFDGDGATEAATVLTLGTAGPNVRLYLLGVGSDGAAIQQEAALLLGRRVQIRGIRTRGNHLEVEMLDFQPGDDPCCPTRETVRRYGIRGGAWVQR